MLSFPPLDPVALSLGPFQVRWYALAYVVAFLVGGLYCRRLARNAPPGSPQPKDYDDLLTWIILGTVLGGRIGYVLFYNLPFYLADPLEALYVWHGGMSFHGGLAGVLISAALFARTRNLPLLVLSDTVAQAVPIGLFLGRLANFVNGELYGRVTDVPWSVIFPHAGDAPRHPSQLYEAGLEGLLLFLLLAVLARSPPLRARHGFLAGAFLTGYALARLVVELFREPDPQLGFLWEGVTMGQVLSLPVLVAGLFLMGRTFRRVSREKA